MRCSVLLVSVRSIWEGKKITVCLGNWKTSPDAELEVEEEDETERNEASQIVADFLKALDHPKELRISERICQRAAKQAKQ